MWVENNKYKGANTNVSLRSLLMKNYLETYADSVYITFVLPNASIDIYGVNKP